MDGSPVHSGMGSCPPPVRRATRGSAVRGPPPFQSITTLTASAVPPCAPGAVLRSALGRPDGPQDSYLVDSASSHMLVSKIKPCMSKYKQLYGETANGSLNQLSFI